MEQIKSQTFSGFLRVFNTPRVVYQEFNEYHLILRGLFKNYKTPTIINKLLLSHVYYGGGFKILK